VNTRKLQLELMRAILKSSTLQYDDAFPVVASFAQAVSAAVVRKEQEVAVKFAEELKKKKLQEEERRKRYESQKTGQ
jgi:hypothetical protein